jgi:hypothetical protein
MRSKCFLFSVAQSMPLLIAVAAIKRSGISIRLFIFFNSLSISAAISAEDESKGNTGSGEFSGDYLSSKQLF